MHQVKTVMFENILSDPELQKYHRRFEAGEVIFQEGETSQDLYILVSGHVEVIKGGEKIFDTVEKGALLGEMSYLLSTPRTGTVRAVSDSTLICIPESGITDFVNSHPEVASEITKTLAMRLDDTNKALFGLKGVCDQLPDAVICTDKNNNIVSWNKAAEHLYGRTWEEMKDKPLAELFVDTDEYLAFISEIKRCRSLQEKIFKINHPKRHTRYISTSTNVLFDENNNVHAVISIGRDVTELYNAQKSYRTTRRWLLPCLFIIGLMAGALIYLAPYMKKISAEGQPGVQELYTILSKDYFSLKSLLLKPFMQKNVEKTTTIMKRFFAHQDMAVQPLTGIIILDRYKEVFDAYSVTDDTLPDIRGSSYAGVPFQGSERSLHRLVTPYRRTDAHPMGKKSYEIAFLITDDSTPVGWLLFQLDMDKIRSFYGADISDILKYHFEDPKNES